MKLPRLLALATLAALACTPALADMTDQQGHLLEIRAAHAPLAVSGDGAWRLHVDAHDVLHRVNLADPARETTVQLPPGVTGLSASADGLKVALATRHQCVGLVDLSTDAARVSWRPWVIGGDGSALGPDTGAWVAQMPATCGADPVATPVAISSDGQLVASTDSVIDGATGRLVASLPTRGVEVLQLRFVDHDARLMIASATLGERWEDAARPSRLGVSVWDLASKSLVNDVDEPDALLATRTSLQTDFSPQTGALFHVDERRDAQSPELVQLSPGACGAAPRPRARLGADVGASFVVDPYGRWFASARPLAAPQDGAELATGARWAIAVQDMATGRTLERVTSKYALGGLVATPDGATLLALASQPVEPQTGEAVAGWPAVPDAERVLQLALPDAATTATRDTAKAWERGVCKEAGETPGARTTTRLERPLKPLWTRDLGAPASTPEDSPCTDANAAPAVFRTETGDFWIDQRTQVAHLDPATGVLALGLPTPRTAKVCSVVTPSGSGFLNAGGDTLSWRPLKEAADPTRRRVIERRAGWRASLVGVRGDVVRVAWSSPSGSVVLADVDSNGKRVREVATTDADADAAAPPAPAPCHDARGTPLAIGYDWRAGPFGSQRGATCGPLPGSARLVWWSGASIAPRLDSSEWTPRAMPAIDGAIAVVSDDRTLHVVNLALQREFAQVDLTDGTDGRAWVLAARRLLMIESTAADGHRWLRGYLLPSP